MFNIFIIRIFLKKFKHEILDSLYLESVLDDTS